MDNNSKNSNNISDREKLKQKLKKWKKQANSSTTSNSNKKGSLSRSNSIKEGITFLKRTLSFGDVSTSGASSNAVPKGFLAVHVGEEMKRFVIPTNYLSHQAFSVLLKEAEEEFGFQQEGILRIPCEVDVFESILKMLDAKNCLHCEQADGRSRKDGIPKNSTEGKNEGRVALILLCSSARDHPSKNV
ncbi:hypothetical protein Cgig2_014098 [Carnegiea gigantea]|uniref:Small auxin up regulated protein n=1 Tax=Carnegiea gigantea TaxID=171969 RepID=A0A9Q1KYW0_9CARY|nr:hypothetical protein Cgig2_014098 [Carnegiea gigantea]